MPVGHWNAGLHVSLVTRPPALASLALMRRGLSIGLLALAALLPLAPRAAAAPLPSDFFGVSSPDVVPMTASQRDATMADQRAGGVRLLRQLFDWDQIERNEGTYDFSAIDGFMASAAR